MRTVIKMVLVVVVLFIGVFLIALTKEVGGPGIVIIAPATFAAMAAIWNYDPDKKKQNKDKY
jgi:predicted tellurium resistance membrane protein TerC